MAAVGALLIVCGTTLPRLFSTEPTATPATQSSTNKLKSERLSPADTGPSLGEMLTRLVLGTVVVCGLAAGSIYLWAKRQRMKQAKPSGPMRILGTLSVGRGFVYLVQVGEQRLLAGTDPTGLKSLIALPAGEHNLELSEPILS